MTPQFLRRLKVRTRARSVAEKIDSFYSAALGQLKMAGPRQSVAVVGVYRESTQIAAAVAEMGRSRHDVRFVLGAMGEAAPGLASATEATEMSAGKFQNMNRLLETLEEQPDWLVIIDDDITLPSGFLDRAIELCHRFDYALAQPAQTRFSNANWSIAKRRLLTVARDSPFVEIGPVTILRRDALELLTPFPKDLKYGWGLDFHWAWVIQDSGLRAGILDLLAVIHSSRKVASTYSWDAAQEEGREFLSTVPHLPPAIGIGEGTVRHRWVPRAPKRVG